MEIKKENYDVKRQYANYYFNHTYYVVLAWKAIRDVLLEKQVITQDEYRIINHLVAWHDNSKISDEEFMAYALGLYSEYKENPEIHEKFKEAVSVHKSRNLHHFESLKDYHGDDWKCYIIELICDYIAVGWQFENYIFEYYEQEKDNIDLPQEYKEYLGTILNIIKECCFQDVETPMTRELESKLFNQ